MKIILLENKDNFRRFDYYDSMVVVAESCDEAIKMSITEADWPEAWPEEFIKAVVLGEVVKDIQKGVVCKNFQA